MEESGPHKQSILRNKEVSFKNAPRKTRDVTRPTVMVKRLGFRGTLPVKYKIDFWNNPITASILVWNQVVLNQSQQLGYLNSKLMLSWDCPFNWRKVRKKSWPMMSSKSDPRGHSGLKLCVHVSVMGYHRFTNFRRNRRGSGSKWHFFEWFHMEWSWR